MKHVLSFLAGALLVVLLATTPKTQELFVIKPATPRSVMVESFSNYYHSNRSVANSERQLFKVNKSELTTHSLCLISTSNNISMNNNYQTKDTFVEKLSKVAFFCWIAAIVTINLYGLWMS